MQMGLDSTKGREIVLVPLNETKDFWLLKRYFLQDR